MTPLERTLMTISCTDADSIPKVDASGTTVLAGGQAVQIMHNGLRVVSGGYYGDWMSHIIRALRGHHEPQEELVFHHLLRYVRHNTTMIELGAFWSYYSQWYLKEVPGSRSICVEPDGKHLQVGRRNAELNGLSDRIRFVEAWVGNEFKPKHAGAIESSAISVELPMLDMTAALELNKNQPIELLHMDAQGAELGFIRSIRHSGMSGNVRFLMVSTHHSSISGSPTTHRDCCHAIQQCGGHVLVEHSVQESYSGDGLILASFLDCDRSIRFPLISRNDAALSLFPTP